MPRDVPTEDKDIKERGMFARRNEDPTITSYLSTLLYVLGVPTLILLAFVGYWRGLYSYEMVVPAFGLLLVSMLVIVFTIMHVRTGR